MEFKNAIKLNNNNAQIYHEYAKFCERHRQPPDYKKATDLYFKACSTDPINFLSAAVDAANLMRRLDTKQSRESAKQLFEKLVIEAPHLNGAFLGYAKLLVREKEYKKVNQILINGLSHHPNDLLLKKYYNEYKTISTSRPSVLYSSNPIDSNNNNNHNHAQTQILTKNDENTNNNNNQLHNISQSNGAIANMQPSQKLNKNIELSTNQFVKGISFDPNTEQSSNTNTTTSVHRPPSSVNGYSITQTPTNTSIAITNKNKSYSNMSAISLSMSEDMHTPPLPHNMNKHNNQSSSSSMNTVRKKDSVFTATATTSGRISHLLNQNSGKIWYTVIIFVVFKTD